MKFLDFLKKKQNDESPKAEKLRNKGAWKHGGYAAALTAVVVAVLVAVNVLFGILAERVNLDIDISLSGENTLSDENVEYIKNLNKQIEITICYAEEDYISGVGYVAENYYNVSADYSTTSAMYFEQTLNLVSLYDVYSDNITVKFADPYDASFTEITKKYTNITPGDIIVESITYIGGEKSVRSEVLSFDDVYSLAEDENSYSSYFGVSSYMISGNKIETALTSAIYKVSSDKTQKVLVLEHHCKKDNLTDYISYLEQNNFDVEIFSDTALNNIDKDVDMVIIAEPTEDFAAEELVVIDEWLYNSAQRGKGIMYFASPSSPDMPNLYSYLEEWGIAFEEGIMYETKAENQIFGEATTLSFVPAASEDDEGAIKKFSGLLENSYVVSGGNVPILQVYEQDGSRVTAPVAVTPADTVVIAPIDAASDWTPDGSYDQNQHIGILMAAETEYVDNILCTSYIAVFSSRDFVDPYWLSQYDVNSDAVLNTAKTISGAEDDGITFSTRKISDNTFSDVVTYDAIVAIRLIFMILSPILMIVAGVVVFIRRSRR